MVGTMRSIPGWTRDIFKDEASREAIRTANDNNEDIAFNRILKVLLARWIVFQGFVEVSRAENAGNLHKSFKSDWLLLQILPLVVIDDKDPFIGLMNTAFVGASTEILEILLKDLTPTKVLGSVYDATRDSFFYVLDEAQIAGSQYMGAFSDGDSVIPRPVLRPIIRAWASLSIQNIKFVVSGTGFSLSLFTTVLTSGVGKDSAGWDVVHTLGDFTNRSVQESYIATYLPPAFLSSPPGYNLLRRMHDWLRGR
jgi:hypothetical protein